MAPTFTESFLGGIRSFFSIWQLCILQFSPFYVAFFLAVFFLLRSKGTRSNLSTMLLAGAGLSTGFSLFFALAGSPGTIAGATILGSLHSLKYGAGVFILSIGLLMMVLSFLGSFSSRALVPAFLSPFVGASFAVAYSPCIPPVLSRIYNYSGEPGNAMKGLAMLFSYGLALSVSATGVAVLFIVFWKIKRKSSGRFALPALTASAVFMIIGLLLLTGRMLSYKRFLVNLF